MLLMLRRLRSRAFSRLFAFRLSHMLLMSFSTDRLTRRGLSLVHRMFHSLHRASRTHSFLKATLVRNPLRRFLADLRSRFLGGVLLVLGWRAVAQEYQRDDH